MDKIQYREYLKSEHWKSKRLQILISRKIICYCCGAEQWQYRVWECPDCKSKYYCEKYIPTPYCECEEDWDKEDFAYKQITDGSEFFHLHHINYKNLGQEKDEDLIIMCEDCHRLAHVLLNIYKEMELSEVHNYLKEEKMRRILS